MLAMVKILGKSSLFSGVECDAEEWDPVMRAVLNSEGVRVIKSQGLISVQEIYHQVRKELRISSTPPLKAKMHPSTILLSALAVLPAIMGTPISVNTSLPPPIANPTNKPTRNAPPKPPGQ